MVEKINIYQSSKMRLRKYTTLELVELEEDNEDFEGEVSVSKKRLRGGKSQFFYTIFDLRDGSHIEKCSKDQVKTFFDLCKKGEKKLFLAVKRTLKRKEGEKRYSLTHESGHHLEDLSSKDVQTLVDKCPKNLLEKFNIVALKEEEVFVATNAPKKKKRVRR